MFLMQLVMPLNFLISINFNFRNQKKTIKYSHERERESVLAAQNGNDSDELTQTR
jgi:hypothetical protein